MREQASRIRGFFIFGVCDNVSALLAGALKAQLLRIYQIA